MMWTAALLLVVTSQCCLAFSTDRILVVGSTGGTGFRALHGLLDVGNSPSQLRVLTRNPNKPILQDLAKTGVEVVQADLEDPASLTSIADGCVGCYIHSTSSDTKKIDEGEVDRARNLANALSKSDKMKRIVYNSAAAEPGHPVKRIAQKHQVEDVLRNHFRDNPNIQVDILRANLFMEELWKGFTRPQILNGKFAFALPPDRKVYLTCVRDMGRLAGSLIQQAPASNNRFQITNVASDYLTCVEMAQSFGTAQGSLCVHSQARTMKWASRLFFRDLYNHIKHYQFSTETTDIAALEVRFPGLLTSFPDFLKETQWGDPDRTFQDFATMDEITPAMKA